MPRFGYLQLGSRLRIDFESLSNPGIACAVIPNLVLSEVGNVLRQGRDEFNGRHLYPVGLSTGVSPVGPIHNPARIRVIVDGLGVKGVAGHVHEQAFQPVPVGSKECVARHPGKSRCAARSAWFA